MMNKKIVILNDSSTDNHYGCSRVVRNLDLLIQEFGGQVVHRLKIGEKIDNPITREALTMADAVIINGEGTFHHGATRAEQMLQLVDEFLLDKYLVNATYDSNPDNFAHYLNKYQAISVRESKSQRELAKYGIEARVLPDLSCYSDSLFYEQRKGFLFGDSVNDEVSWALLQHFRPKAEYAVNQVHFYGKSRIKPLAHFIKSLRKKKAIKYKVKRAFFQLHETSPEAYHQSIARAEGIVTGRYHAICFAINSLTPFIAISSNSHKVEGLMEDIGLKNRIVAKEDISKIERIHSFTADEQESIKRYLITGRTNTYQFYQKIMS